MGAATEPEAWWAKWRSTGLYATMTLQVLTQFRSAGLCTAHHHQAQSSKLIQQETGVSCTA